MQLDRGALVITAALTVDSLSLRKLDNDTIKAVTGFFCCFFLKTIVNYTVWCEISWPAYIITTSLQRDMF